jgi:FAD/FMN-containing dehydrogenase
MPSNSASRSRLDPAMIARFAEIVGTQFAITSPDAQTPYLREWRDLYVGTTPLVLKPGTTEEVSRIVALAHAEGIGVVPQGGNTGLVGGQIPRGTSEILLSLTRLNRIRSIDAAGETLTAEAGVTLQAAQDAARAAGRLFPLSLASEGSATIGGNVATNAGGVAVLAYGSMRQLVSGLEVVLADGTVWHGLRALKKDNTGYDLRDLFIGSEGTLGIVTAATLKLFPEPRERAVALVALPSLAALLPFFQLAQQRAGSTMTAFEFMCAGILSFVIRHIPGTRMPLEATAPWYALIEISGATPGAAPATLEGTLAEALASGLASDAAVAGSLSQAADLWKLRDAASEAQKGEGGSIKHDVSVPVAALPEFLTRAADAVEAVCPGARPVPFGHFGDGNVHYNVSQPPGMERARYLALWAPMSRAVHDIVVSLDGSISAEHGIGQLKVSELVRVKSAVELDLMRKIKGALDPKGLLNPGKILGDDDRP